MTSKRNALTRFILLIGFGVTMTPVMADSPHFVGQTDATINSVGELVVSWKEAGLGNNQLISYYAGADASGFYACINGGGQHPQATNKEAFEGPVSGSGTFSSGQNGQVTASLTISPPSSTLDCPNGQSLVLACVTYSNIFLMDTTNGIDGSAPSAVSKTFFALPECL